MKKQEVVLQVRKVNDLSYLEPFGTVVFSDDIIDIVVLECDSNKVEDLKQHPLIIDVRQSRNNGTALEVSIN